MATKDQTTNNNFNPRTPEPVITYDHMEQVPGMKIKPAGQMPVWSFVIEETNNYSIARGALPFAVSA